MDIFINSAYVCLDKFYVGKFHLNSAMCYSHHLPTEGWHTRRRVWHLDFGRLDFGRLDYGFLEFGRLDPGCSKKHRHSTRSIPRNSGNWQNPWKIAISFLRW